MPVPGPLSGYQVLVVEDDTDSRNAIQLTLEASGASVVTAASASEALASMAAQPCDVVVSDLAMPEQSGFWLIAKIRQLFPRRHVPVIAVTGHPFPADGVRRAGFDDVMQKPPDPDALCAAVAALLSERGTPKPVDEQNAVVTRGRGDDFAIVLPNTSRAGAVAYAERIKTSSESHPFEHGRMTASLGVPALPESVTIAEELIGGAYQSVSDAKRSGGNRVAVL